MPQGPATEAIVIQRPGSIGRHSVHCTAPTATDLVVDVEACGVSTGTEKLLWEGTMPAFPGLGYPLVPGYEAVGRVASAGDACRFTVGERVFVPGTTCYDGEVRGLFGASAAHLVVPENRVTAIGTLPAEHGVLLALAATAMHALTIRLRHQPERKPAALRLAELQELAPQLIIGHGVLGRLIARLCLAVGAPAPIVWESTAVRRSGALGYTVIATDDDDRADYQRVCDVSGAVSVLDTLIGRCARGAHLTLAGFYSEPIGFDFAPAFMRELQISIAAEWLPEDLALVQSLLQSGALSLDGLVSHTVDAQRAETAYPQAFSDPDCLKMILHWSQP